LKRLHPRWLPHSKPQLHLILWVQANRKHLFSEGDKRIEERWLDSARRGEMGRCMIEHLNGFGQVTHRECFYGKAEKRST
jgi:hypothetical protein